MTVQFPNDYYPPEPGELILDQDNAPGEDDGEDSIDLTPDDGSNRPSLPDDGDPGPEGPEGAEQPEEAP